MTTNRRTGRAQRRLTHTNHSVWCSTCASMNSDSFPFPRYNGQIWDPISASWSEINWSGVDLQPGQSVGVLVVPPPIDQMFLFVDGELKIRGPKNICGGVDPPKPIYGIVDLIGNTSGVTLISAPPPPAASGLAPTLVIRTLFTHGFDIKHFRP